MIYLLLEYKIDGRKTKLENMLPDYLQITSANLRSGIALDRAMLLAARPEFAFLSDDVKDDEQAHIRRGELRDRAAALREQVQVIPAEPCGADDTRIAAATAARWQTFSSRYRRT